LISLAEGFAGSIGARRIESSVAGDAVTFYTKCGYTPLEKRDLGSSSVRMYKDIAAAGAKV